MIHINDVIVEAYKLRQYELRVDNITMRINLGKNIPQTCADPYQLQQVFINLINNAHDALKENDGGFLKICTSKEKRDIVIEFEDNGVGIKKDQLKKTCMQSLPRHEKHRTNSKKTRNSLSGVLQKIQ